MRTMQTTSNSVELRGSTKTGRDYTIVFSYGRPIAARFNGNHFINLSTWKHSSTTTRHLYSAICHFKDISNIIDKQGELPYLNYAVNDDQISRMIAEELSK